MGDGMNAVVTLANPERLAAYREHLHLPFDVVADTDRRLFRLPGAGAVVGRNGDLRYVSLPSTPDARPPIGELIAAFG
jgi:hypothetical protein